MDDKIKQITIDYLMNNNPKNKNHKNNKDQMNKVLSDKDKKFYRKRIINATKELLSGNFNHINTQDIEFAFDIYIKLLVNYYKINDKNDLFQNEYKDLSEMSEMSENKEIETTEMIEMPENKEIEMSENNLLLMRKINIKNKVTGNLDNFVVTTSNKNEPHIILPKKRKVNIKHPDLKNKGITTKENTKENTKII